MMVHYVLYDLHTVLLCFVLLGLHCHVCGICVINSPISFRAPLLTLAHWASCQIHKIAYCALPHIHHGTRVTQVPWRMPGSLTTGFLWSRWRGIRSRHSRRLCNPQFHVSGKRPMAWLTKCQYSNPAGCGQKTIKRHQAFNDAASHWKEIYTLCLIATWWIESCRTFTASHDDDKSLGVIILDFLFLAGLGIWDQWVSKMCVMALSVCTCLNLIEWQILCLSFNIFERWILVVVFILEGCRVQR